MTSRRVLAVGGTGLLLVGAAGCGASGQPSSSASGGSQAVNPNGPEVNPAGDIPDNQAYVAYQPQGASFTVKVPEGWARTTANGTTSFTDKLNRIEMKQASATGPLTPADAKRTTLPMLRSGVPGFVLGKVTTVSRTAGMATLITYQATSQPDAVTGKTHTDAVERYTFFHHGKRVILTLSGPKGADNVDPWKIVTDSLRYSA